MYSVYLYLNALEEMLLKTTQSDFATKVIRQWEQLLPRASADGVFRYSWVS